MLINFSLLRRFYVVHSNLAFLETFQLLFEPFVSLIFLGHKIFYRIRQVFDSLHPEKYENEHGGKGRGGNLEPRIQLGAKLLKKGYTAYMSQKI